MRPQKARWWGSWAMGLLAPRTSEQTHHGQTLGTGRETPVEGPPRAPQPSGRAGQSPSPPTPAGALGCSAVTGGRAPW